MADVIKRGYVLCHFRGMLKVKWHRQWCIFHTENGQTKLDFFSSESATKNHPALTILLSNVQGIERETVKDRDNVFLITAEEKRYLFATDSEFDTNNWVKVVSSMRSGNHPGSLVLPKRPTSNSGSRSSSRESIDDVTFDENILYEPAEQPEVFVVEIQDSEAAQRCRLRGEYLFNVNTMNISLSSRNNPQHALYVFPFRYIRRYGKSKTNFTFEAGRKCVSGEGIFTLRTSQSAEIQSAIQTAINTVKKRNASPNLSRQKSPVAPPRNLGGANYQNMPKPNKAQDQEKSAAVSPSFLRKLPTARPVVPQKPRTSLPRQPAIEEPKALYATPDEPIDAGYGEIYSQPHKLQNDDAWKSQGTTQIMHEENYGNIQRSKSSGSRFSGAVLNDPIDNITDSVKSLELQDGDAETYGSYDKLDFKVGSKRKKHHDEGNTYASVGSSEVSQDVVYSQEATYEDAIPIDFAKGGAEYDYIGHSQLRK